MPIVSIELLRQSLTAYVSVEQNGLKRVCVRLEKYNSESRVQPSQKKGHIRMYVAECSISYGICMVGLP